MKILRHCRERLPHGEKIWRRAARLVGFTGTLRVTGLGQKAWNLKEIKHPQRKRYGITRGFFLRPNQIWVFVTTSPCARAVWTPMINKLDPLTSFCHELGHFVQEKEGRRHPRGSRKTMQGWRNDPFEREADRIGRSLRKRLHV